MASCMKSLELGGDFTDGTTNTYWCGLVKGHDGPHQYEGFVFSIEFENGEIRTPEYKITICWEEVKGE